MAKASELRSKDVAALETEITDLLKSHFNLRMQRATGQLSKPDQFAKVRKNIARIKTLMTEQSNKSKTGGAA